MIYIHYYQIGTNENKKEHRFIHDDFDKAKAQQQVLGGVIQAFESVENINDDLAEREYIKELVVDEVSCIIDELSTDAPGFARNLEPGSSEWDCWKVKTLNNLRNILDGKFNESE